LRHGRLLAAFLTGQIHSSGGPIRDQRGFAMLAMKEDVGIGRDSTQRMFRRFHNEQTSRGRAGARKFQIPKPKLQGNFKPQLPKFRGMTS
jgi:hypothetical protein